MSQEDRNKESSDEALESSVEKQRADVGEAEETSARQSQALEERDAHERHHAQQKGKREEQGGVSDG